MAIRFKFRSSVQFDSVEIDNRPSISVRELRSRIVRHKNLNSNQDLDLVFSDHVTGKEFMDEDYQIPSGTSIIIKRVPAGLARESCDLPDNSKVNISKFVEAVESRKMIDEEDLDDFGVDLCPIPEATSYDYELGLDKRYWAGGDETNGTVHRYSGVPISRCQMLEASDVSEACTKGLAGSVSERKVSLPKVNSTDNEQFKLHKEANLLYMQTPALPSELKCSICNTFFKDAVMIPCCQHSFCDKCIRTTLLIKAKCPKCSSTKCRVDDLLPNVSLRQAIDHFVHSQILPIESENAFHNDAPDEESGIQAVDIPSTTGLGSKQITTEPVYHSTFQKTKHNDDEGDGSNYPLDVRNEPQPDYQGENQPNKLPHTRMHEADSSLKRKREVVNYAGGDSTFVNAGRHKKGEQTCFMCGSPDHFIRDCPIASSPHPALQSGSHMLPGAIPVYTSPYWNAAYLPHNRPFAHPYWTPGMMPFNAAMVPISPFTVSPYMASMYGGSPAIGEYMRTGFEPPVRVNAEHPYSHLVTGDLQEPDIRWKQVKKYMGREHYCDDKAENIDKPNRHKFHRDSERSLSCSDDSYARRSQKKHQLEKHYPDDFLSNDSSFEKSSHSSTSAMDRRQCQLEGSRSIVEDMSNISNGRNEERHKYHHRGSKKHKQREVQCSSDSNASHHKKTRKKNIKKYEVEFNGEISNAKISSHSNKSSRHRENLKVIELGDDRWQMVCGLDDNCGGESHLSKRKRKY